MTATPAPIDAVVIGGGFYGVTIAIYLVQERGFKRVVLLEREPSLLTRASYHNQARVHNGYHYPRSFTTAFRSRVNFPRFLHDWPNVISSDFIKLYAIAKRNSKVTAKQFERFCTQIGATIQTAGPELQKLFEPRLVEAVYQVEECAFDAVRLAAWAQNTLKESNITVKLATRAKKITHTEKSGLLVSTLSSKGEVEALHCKYVFNCTYSGLNQIDGDFAGTSARLKHEVAEMALIAVPSALKNIGVTVMDGPFFSMMPFPAKHLHTISHVRYTPHFSWEDQTGTDPYQKLSEYKCESRVQRMLRDASRYIPAVLDSTYVQSLFEVKTVLQKNESDDGRPILFERHNELLGCYSILGGKIDNIYDVLEKLGEEKLDI